MVSKTHSTSEEKRELHDEDVHESGDVIEGVTNEHNSN